jgi:hypothetical protein
MRMVSSIAKKRGKPGWRQKSFDERKSMGKRLNAQVIKLDGEFAKVLGQIEQLKSQVEARLVAWLERFERWRSYSSARSAFRVALCTYVIVLVPDRDPLEHLRSNCRSIGGLCDNWCAHVDSQISTVV